MKKINMTFTNIIFAMLAMYYCQPTYANLDRFLFKHHGNNYALEIASDGRKYLRIDTKMAKEIVDAITSEDKIIFMLNFEGCIFSESALSEMLAAIQKNKHLRCLGFVGNDLTLDDFKAIARILRVSNGLTSLNISANSVDYYGAIVIAESLKTNTGLRQLILSENNINDSIIGAILASLNENRTLTKLSFYSNNISYIGAALIADFLSRTDSILVELDLGDNQIKDKGLMPIMQALQKNNTLEKINLESNSISSKSGEIIAQTLRINKTLSFLNLSKNGMTGSIQMIVDDGLNYNETLTDLFLEAINMDMSDITAISKLLKKNDKLRTIDLGRNRIGDEGMKMLALSLLRNANLTKLCLAGNDITDIGAAVMADVLQNNKILIDVDLSMNSIEDAGALEIITALRNNNTLSSLDLAMNNIIFKNISKEMILLFLKNVVMSNFNFEEGCSITHEDRSDLYIIKKFLLRNIEMRKIPKGTIMKKIIVTILLANHVKAGKNSLSQLDDYSLRKIAEYVSENNIDGFYNTVMYGNERCFWNLNEDNIFHINRARTLQNWINNKINNDNGDIKELHMLTTKPNITPILTDLSNGSVIQENIPILSVITTPKSSIK